MAVVQREVRKRGAFGKIIKFLFIAFNLAMIVWLASYWIQVGGMIGGAGSDAERAGGAVGATLATGMLVFFWAAGAIILGLLTAFTRGPRMLITDER